MAMFNSKLLVYQMVNPIKSDETTIFQWFSHGFQSHTVSLPEAKNGYTWRVSAAPQHMARGASDLRLHDLWLPDIRALGEIFSDSMILSLRIWWSDLFKIHNYTNVLKKGVKVSKVVYLMSLYTSHGHCYYGCHPEFLFCIQGIIEATSIQIYLMPWTCIIWIDLRCFRK